MNVLFLPTAEETKQWLKEQLFQLIAAISS